MISTNRLVTWEYMAKFQGHMFCVICAHLRDALKFWGGASNGVLEGDNLRQARSDLAFIAAQCNEAGLSNVAAYIQDELPRFADADSVAAQEFLTTFGNLQQWMSSEMRRIEFIRVDKQQFYSSKPLFKPFITDIYPVLTYDVVEAGNCLALDRATACVFHLMRVVEFGVQELGDKLGVPLAKEIVWQTIMNQVNKKIGEMPDKPPHKKRTKEVYSDVAGHLYNVKVAWRNPVMHPNKTYTAEEAEHLFLSVGRFMEALIKLLKPRLATRPPQVGSSDEDWLDALAGPPDPE